MFKSIVAGALGIITVLTVLEIFGINVTSMLAGVGIAGIIIGVALQDSLKDIIRGFVIISDNYYEMGDVIKFGENVGVVESVSLLTGPEGGLEASEVEQAAGAGLQVCTLGKRILRCETAPLCALSAVMYDAGEF